GAAHELDRVDGVGAGGRYRAGVDLEVQVRAGGVAGGTDEADHAAGRDPLADHDLGLADQVAVAGGDVAGVHDVDVPAAAGHRLAAVDVAGPARGVAHGHDDGAGGGGAGLRVRVSAGPLPDSTDLNQATVLVAGVVKAKA